MLKGVELCMNNLHGLRDVLQKNFMSTLKSLKSLDAKDILT
jgi:hypothetical protein